MSSRKSSLAHLFSSDRPIMRRDEDRLNRRKFSEQIADAVRGWKGSDSLVIALYGSWGTGKTSIKNMVVESLRDAPEGVNIVDFNPWQVAATSALTETFFDEIGIALGKGTIASRKEKRTAVAKLKRYAARLKGARGLLNLFVQPLRLVLIVSAALLLGSAVPAFHPVAIAAGIIFAITAVLTWSATLTPEDERVVAAFRKAESAPRQTETDSSPEEEPGLNEA